MEKNDVFPQKTNKTRNPNLGARSALHTFHLVYSPYGRVCYERQHNYPPSHNNPSPKRRKKTKRRIERSSVLFLQQHAHVSPASEHGDTERVSRFWWLARPLLEKKCRNQNKRKRTEANYGGIPEHLIARHDCRRALAERTLCTSIIMICVVSPSSLHSFRLDFATCNGPRADRSPNRT